MRPATRSVFGVQDDERLRLHIHGALEGSGQAGGTRAAAGAFGYVEISE